MTDWIDYAVYVAFLVTLWFVQPTTQRKLAIPMLKDRNAEWLAAHPDVARKVEKRRWNLWLGYVLGAISIGVLTSFQLGFWTPPAPRYGLPLLSWMVLWDLTMSSMLMALIVGGSIGLVGYFRTKKYIPIAAQRQATLEPRSLGDSVPLWVRLATYAVVIANLVAWVAAAALGAHSSPVFWPRVVTMFVLSGFFYFATAISVGRKPNVFDRIFGPRYRHWEVRITFSTQILTPIIGAVRLYEEVNNTHLLDISRAIQLILASFITYWLLRISLLPIDRNGSRLGRRPMPTASLSS
jgi:hypothetical protein